MIMNSVLSPPSHACIRPGSIRHRHTRNTTLQRIGTTTTPTTATTQTTSSEACSRLGLVGGGGDEELKREDDFEGPKSARQAVSVSYLIAAAARENDGMQQHTFGIRQGSARPGGGGGRRRPASSSAQLPSTACQWSVVAVRRPTQAFEVVGAVGGRPLVGHVQLGCQDGTDRPGTFRPRPSPARTKCPLESDNV